MHNLGELNLAKFSVDTNYDSFFEEDYFREFESDGEINQVLDGSDFDQMDDYRWDENGTVKGVSLHTSGEMEYRVQLTTLRGSDGSARPAANFPIPRGIYSKRIHR